MGYKKIDPAIKRRWLKQLRSGELIQRTGALGTKDTALARYCCLGVLVDKCGIKGKVGATWIGTVPALALESSLEEQGFNGFNTYRESKLTSRAREVVGMDATAQDVLISMNDSGQSFTAIADWIEANL